MITTPLPSPLEVKTLLPLSSKTSAFIEEAASTAKNILLGKDMRKALIVGPCSIHESKSAIEYAEKLKALSERVSHTCFLVMRVYVEKSRTLMGWKGLLYDPHLDGSHDIKTGILWTRELLLTLAKMQIPCATEFVDPLAAPYFDDLITWGFIGARTSSSQLHRQFASHLNIPVGFKNHTDGDLDSAIHATLSSQMPHTRLYINSLGHISNITTQGNPHSHIVLRGSNTHTNYDSGSIDTALRKLHKLHLPQRILIDCSHGNCQKKFEKQEDVFLSVLEQIENGNEKIFGLMLESHLEEGNQPLIEDPSQLKYAISITDPCLDWDTTEKLILTAHSKLEALVTA